MDAFPNVCWFFVSHLRDLCLQGDNSLVPLPQQTHLVFYPEETFTFLSLLFQFAIIFFSSKSVCVCPRKIAPIICSLLILKGTCLLSPWSIIWSPSPPSMSESLSLKSTEHSTGQARKADFSWIVETFLYNTWGLAAGFQSSDCLGHFEAGRGGTEKKMWKAKDDWKKGPL